VDYVNYWRERAEIPAKQIVAWLGVGGSKFFDWKKRYGKVNEHNGPIPRDFWLEDWEKKRILDFHSRHPLEGYRRLAFMMLDAGVVAVSPSSVYRVLRKAGVMDRFNGKPSKKGTGFHGDAIVVGIPVRSRSQVHGYTCRVGRGIDSGGDVRLR
jgi:putative transposase